MQKFRCKKTYDTICDSCFFNYPECGGKDVDIDFGDGISYDNIIECDGYEPCGEMPEDIEVINK